MSFSRRFLFPSLSIAAFSAFLFSSGSRAAPPPLPPLAFQRTSLDATGERPEICLHFDQNLNAQDTPTLAHFVHLSPELPFTPRIEASAFCLGDLAFAQAYRVTVDPAFASTDGRHLAAPLVLNARFGRRESSVAFAGDGFILPGRAPGHVTGLAVESVNVATVRVHVFRLSAHRQFPGLTGIDSTDLNLSQTSFQPWAFRHLLDTSLREVWHGTMTIDSVPDHSTTTAFPLADTIGTGQPGLYLVTIENAAIAREKSPVETALKGRDDGRYGPQSQMIAAHWVNLSNLGLTMLRGEDGLTVSTRSLMSGQPAAGVNLTLRARDGGVLGSVTTDASGLGHFDAPLLRGTMADRPLILLASQGDDFGFLLLDRQWFDFSEHHVDGADSGPPGDNRALLQPDRGIYRPGETVHLLALLRDRAGNALDNARPTLVLRRPDMMEERRIQLTGEAEGGYAVTLPLSASAPTGLWRADILLDPSLPPIGSARFEVQDFVPPVIEANFKPPAFASIGQEITIDATVRFLYGAPGAGLKSDSSYRIVPAADPVPGHKGWAFGFENEDIPSGSGDIGAIPTDRDGHARLAFTPDIPQGLTRPLDIDVRAGFLDPMGRRVGEHLTIPVRRTAPLIGLHVAADASADTGSAAIPIDLASFAPDNSPIAIGNIHWTLARINRIYNWSHTSDNGWTFSSHTVDVPMRSGDLTTDARGMARITPMLGWGEYRLSAMPAENGGATGTSLHFQVGWGGGGDASTPDRLPLSVRDPQIAPGGQTIIHISGGFAGQAQVTLATDRVLNTRFVDVPKEGLDIPVTATPDWDTGAYALVTLYRPLNGPSGLRPHDPVRAVGVAWIGVNQDRHRLDVALDAPETVVPRRRITLPVTVHAAQGTSVDHVRIAVAAVDQGILNLTHFKPLDLFDALYGRRRLGLDMLDNYGALLLSDAKAGHIRAGGDGAAADSGADGPPVRTTKSVALFDGPVALDPAGHGSVSFEVPDFDGRLHLMASAWSEDAVGNAQGDITTRDPVFPDLGLPRFLAPGDTAQALVSIVNVDGPAARYDVQVTTDGPLRVAGPAMIGATVKSGDRADLRVQLTAMPSLAGRTAVAHVHLALRRAGSSAPLLTRSWPIGIRLAHVPVTVTRSVLLQPGDHQTWGATALAGFDPADTQVTLGISASGGIDTIGLLQSLQSSLWGDSDTLAAQARALLQVTTPAWLGMHETRDDLHKNIQSVIDTLFDRQNPSGEIGQWERSDGRSLPDDQDYLADFLIRAKAAGYDVPEDRLGLLLDQIESEQVQSLSSDGDDADRETRAATLNTRAYATYVLARAGRLHPDGMRDLAASLIARQDGGHVSYVWAGTAGSNAQAHPLALGHLAVALALDDAPDDDSATSPGALLDAAIVALGPPRAGKPDLWDYKYWTYVRDLAGLAALTAEAHDDRRTRLLVDRFGRLTLAYDDLMNVTKTALLEAASAMNADTAGRSVRVRGQADATPLHLPLIYPFKPAALERGIPIENTGRKTLFSTLTLHGEPAGNVQPLANGLTLEMKGFSLGGAPFDLTHMKQNDRFIVSLGGTALNPGNYQVVITSLLPAGWEIESIVSPEDAAPEERYGRDAEDDRTKPPYAFLGILSRTEHAAALDDRFSAVLRFSTRSPELAARGFHVAYIVRATTRGHFALPEAVVSARYRPSLMARTASGSIEIAPH
ncbi:alpha-2-macroglobulin family protein [Acidomonas methanolica]|uniref:alpha-2-macroglobulin family protein n=1 Tax=Acidomonas methanolica TaxID=437 RepID=UPI00211A966E|nr:MG2 domain-containing protein [Acidomonas methanolica]MCQ9156310.1 alpha-2-macroglobulin family protein [Acidomonas methanolica]